MLGFFHIAMVVVTLLASPWSHRTARAQETVDGVPGDSPAAASAAAPGPIVLRFAGDAAGLDRTAIRLAIERELGTTLALDAEGESATLTVEGLADNQLRMTYRPTPEVLTRTVVLANVSDTYQLIAHLAGNLVRDEADALARPAATPAAAGATGAAGAAGAAGAGDAVMPAQTAEATPDVAPCSAEPAPAPSVDPSAPYLADAWIFSALAGGVAGGDEQGQLTLQLSKRFDRAEWGLSARLAIGRVDASRTTDTDYTEERVTAVVLTLPLSFEYRVLGHRDAYLQLGGLVGYRVVGISSGSDSLLSGSDGQVALGIQATMGFAVGDNHGVVGRFGWELTNASVGISRSDGDHQVQLPSTVAQLGWQFAF